MNRLIAALFLIGLCANSYAQDASRLEALEKRIRDLEDQQAQLLSASEEPRPKVYSFLNNNLTFGGFFEPGYTVLGGEDTDTQASTANLLAMNIAADFQQNFRFVGQTITAIGFGLQNQHNDPRAASATFPSDREYITPVFATLLTQGFLEYKSSRLFNIQSGLGYVPLGYAFQQRELVLFWRRNGPQILRTTQLVQPLWTGVHIHGSDDRGDHILGYNAYTFSPGKNLRAIGFGGRGWWSTSDDRIVLGLSGQVAKGEGETYEIVGTDVKVEYAPFVVRAEYVHQITEDDDPWSAYVEPGIYLFDEKWLFYVFGDYANNSLNETIPTLSDPVRKWEYGAGVNFLPTSFTRYRFGLTWNDYVGDNDVISGQERDYWSVDISAGVAF